MPQSQTGRCRGPSRRDVLRIGAVGGLGLPALLRSRSARASDAAVGAGALPGFGRAKNCILVFLTGGPPQHDTWDPKPEAPAGIRGELGSIPTLTPGVRFGELFPQLARRSDKLCILRTMNHRAAVHTSAGYAMLTGNPNVVAGASAAEIKPSPDDRPHVGSLLAKHRDGRSPLPPFVALPEIIKDAGINEFPGLNAGFLGREFDPLRIESTLPAGGPGRVQSVEDKATAGFVRPDMLMRSDMTVNRLDGRRRLLDRMNREFEAASRGTQPVSAYHSKAFEMIRSPAARKAFDFEAEPAKVRDTYGRHLFAQGCLQARRLVEAGVGLVTVYWHYEGPDDSPVWDTHWNNAPHMRNRLGPPTDRALSALLDDLGGRGMLDETLVVCMGEFGRTPKINKDAGRDHWPHVQSLWLAGAGVRAGSVYGASDRDGAFPAHSPVGPAELAATMLHLLGVPGEMEIHDRLGRPFPAAEAKPIAGLLA